MGVFIIVKFMKKIKLKYNAFRQKRIAAYIVLAVCSLSVIYVLLIKDAGGVKPLEGEKINLPETTEKSEILYTVNNDFTELRNPFSFEHETENDERQRKNETAENKLEQSVISDNGVKAKENSADKNPAATVKENKKINSAETAKNYKTEAVFDINGHKSALLKLNNEEIRVEVGDKIKNATVTDITKKGVVLYTAGGKSIDCPLNDFSAEKQR